LIYKTHDKIGTKRNIMSYGTEYLGKSPSSYELLVGIPSSIKGLGLGYLMYKQFIQYLGFASSTQGSSKESQAVWKKLSQDENLTGLILNLKNKYRDFIDVSKSEFIMVSLNIDDFLKSKGISEQIN
jgi:hypothetical protein